MAFPEPVSLGSPFREFPAASFNAMVADNAHIKAVLRTLTNPQGRGRWPYLATQLHNSTDTDLEVGNILGYSEITVALTDDANQPYNGMTVKGVSPSVPAHSNRFAVALDGISAGAIGAAAFVGLVAVKVNWTDDTHDRVIVEGGETLLQSGTSGIEPVWHEELTGLPAEKWALLLLGGGSGSKRTSLLQATDTITGKVSGDTPSTSEDYTVIDGDIPAGAISNWSTQSISTDTYLITIQIGSADVIVQAFC